MNINLIDAPGSKYYNYCKWNNEKYKPYDYVRYGLLNRIASRRILYAKEELEKLQQLGFNRYVEKYGYTIKTENETLNIILHYIQDSLIFVLKYIDRLKNFKNVRWKNR